MAYLSSCAHAAKRATNPPLVDASVGAIHWALGGAPKGGVCGSGANVMPGFALCLPPPDLHDLVYSGTCQGLAEGTPDTEGVHGVLL